MAGSYPDAPSRRMAWDEDCVFLITDRAGYLVEYGASVRQELNDEDDTASGTSVTGGRYMVVIFPELRELDGCFCRMDAVDTNDMYYSLDTTNGIDGTVVLESAAPGWGVGSVSPAYRENILSMAVSNVRAAMPYRVSGTNTLRALHVYGEVAPAQTPNRLLFVDTGTGLEFSLPVDYGDVPRGSASDFTMKLRNNSTTVSAGTVQITAEALYLASGNWYTYSEGGAFQSTLQLASSIGPSADSPTITTRRIIPDAETLGLHAGRCQVSVGSWT